MRTIVFLVIVIMIQSCDMDKLPTKEFNFDHSRGYHEKCDVTWTKINIWMISKNVDTKLNDKEDGLIQFEMIIPDSLVYKYTDYVTTKYQNNFQNIVSNVYILVKPIGNFTKLI